MASEHLNRLAKSFRQEVRERLFSKGFLVSNEMSQMREDMGLSRSTNFSNQRPDGARVFEYRNRRFFVDASLEGEDLAAAVRRAEECINSLAEF